MRRERARSRPPHQAVGLALVDLIEAGCSTRDQSDADDRSSKACEIQRRAGTQVVPNGGSDDNEKVQPGFGEREKVCEPLAVERSPKRMSRYVSSFFSRA